ncbi:MAG: PEGA domain-containing protein [Candidatus Nomurabacteria bacterium]|jgi:hypothetical protein|nr:PEGA domain-containing protein [Candidatus Nomurabacteria bacterium]
MHKYKRFKVNKVIIANTVMVLAVVLIVSVLVLITMGYSLTRDGRVEQTGLVQLASVPSSATVRVDGETQFSKTTTKATLTPGEHSFAISRDGYDTWSKKVNVQPGRVLWLNYTRLLPNKKTNKTVKSYETLYKMSTSPKAQYILFLWPAPELTAQLIDVRSDDVKVQDLQPATFFTDLGAEGIQHDLQIKEWNKDENKVLVRHAWGERTEWVLLDLKDMSRSVNLTSEYKLSVSDVRFTSNSGDKLLMLENGNLRRADIGNKTVSAVLVSSVLAMSRVSENEALLITDNPTASTRSFSFYKNGDRGVSEIYSLDATKQLQLNVVGGEYYNDDYVAIGEGSHLQILKGNYPTFGKVGTPLSHLVDITLDWPIERLELSVDKRLVYAMNGGKVYNYDLENRIGRYFTLSGTYESAPRLHWLDNHMLWTDSGGQLEIYDFDGDNKRAVQKLEPGFDIALANKGKWLYSVVKTETGYNLQRLRMILE